jgi:rubrerythrin
MNSVRDFLAHAMALESSAALRYDDLASAMEVQGSPEVARFFAQMAGYCRQHLKEAQARGGFRHVQPPAAGYTWRAGESPEEAGWEGVDGFMKISTAVALALACEEGSEAYYRRIAGETADPVVRKLAAEFADEEAGHARALRSQFWGESAGDATTG